MPLVQFDKPTTRAEWAASIAVCLFCTMGAIQVGIAVGVLPSDIVWGGAVNEEITFWASVASLVACIILCSMAYIIYRRAKPTPSKFIRGASWFITSYMALNTLGNALGKTWVERYVFGAITAMLCVCSFIVASSSEPHPEAASPAPYGSID